MTCFLFTNKHFMFVFLINVDLIIFDEHDGLTYLVSGNVIGVIVIIGGLVLTGSTIVVHGSSNFIYAVTKIKI